MPPCAAPDRKPWRATLAPPCRAPGSRAARLRRAQSNRFALAAKPRRWLSCALQLLETFHYRALCCRGTTPTRLECPPERPGRPRVPPGRSPIATAYPCSDAWSRRSPRVPTRQLQPPRPSLFRNLESDREPCARGLPGLSSIRIHFRGPRDVLVR